MGLVLVTPAVPRDVPEIAVPALRVASRLLAAGVGVVGAVNFDAVFQPVRRFSETRKEKMLSSDPSKDGKR